MKKIIKNYYWNAFTRVSLSIFILIIGWGWLGPALVGNAQSDIGVFLGIAIAIIAPMLVFMLTKPLINLKK